MHHVLVRPGVFPPVVRAQATAIACSLPCDGNVALARWSRAEIVRHLAQHPALLQVSAGTIGRWLAEERIRPWRYQMWQHIQDPAAFLARARPVLQIYSTAGSLLHSGTWTVCVDEKTSIQAREAEQAPQAAIRGHRRRQSPRYTRRGARHLFAGLSVADGKVLGQCRTRKRFVDFQAFISTVVVPEAVPMGAGRENAGRAPPIKTTAKTTDDPSATRATQTKERQMNPADASRKRGYARWAERRRLRAAAFLGANPSQSLLKYAKTSCVPLQARSRSAQSRSSESL